MKTHFKICAYSVVVLIICPLLGFSKRARSPEVAVLQVYPRVFKFNNGGAALYYKQMGKETVNAYYNGSEISPKCFKIRYIYSLNHRIDGYWVKCLLPNHFGTFIVKTPLGIDRYRNFDMFKL